MIGLFSSKIYVVILTSWSFSLAIWARALHRSEPMLNTFGFTSRYLPLPHPERNFGQVSRGIVSHWQIRDIQENINVMVGRGWWLVSIMVVNYRQHCHSMKFITFYSSLTFQNWFTMKDIREGAPSSLSALALYWFTVPLVWGRSTIQISGTFHMGNFPGKLRVFPETSDTTFGLTHITDDGSRL